VRDLKAAVRFVRAQAARFGVDGARIAVTGGSAGATNALAAGVTFEEDYFAELTEAQDPTLASTHPWASSAVQAVYGHWTSDGEVALAQAHDALNRSRYSAANAPVIEFHGDNDQEINITHAYAVQAEYNRTGVPYELVVLEGCGHSSWCYNGKGVCTGPCPNGLNTTDGYDPTMDAMALPFLSKSLGVPLVP
jgi:acetyl esterase/lipase